MKKILGALIVALALSGCVSGIPEDSPTSMIPMVKVHAADTPGGIASKAGRSGRICHLNADGRLHCLYTPIQFWPPQK
jgi:hypothetical protein